MNINLIILNIIIFIVIIFLALTTTLFFKQSKILYPINPNSPAEKSIAERNLEYWVNKEDNYRGLISKERDRTFKGTVIVFHGNGQTAVDRNYYSDRLVNLGYRVLLAEYPGYGGRKGKPSEGVLVDDARETIRLVHQKYSSPIYVWGESLGSGVVASTVSDLSLPVAGIMLITPWDSLPNLAQNLYKFLPVRWFVLDKFDSINNLKSFSGKIGILIAEKDEIIPAKLGHNLARSISNKQKKIWSIEDAGHNNWGYYINDSWWQEVMSFLEDD